MPLLISCFYHFQKQLLALIIMFTVFCNLPGLTNGQGITVAKLKYEGGGDWYANKTALPNLIDFCNNNLNTNLTLEEEVVDVGSPEIFLYPYVYMTGHGNVVFTDDEARLQRYVPYIVRVWGIAYRSPNLSSEIRLSEGAAENS